MKSVQGFVSISQYINNTPGVVSPIGELSTLARTYSKESGQYRDDVAPGYVLTTFKVADSFSGVEVPVGTDQAKIILDIARATVAYASSHMLPYDVQDFRVAVAAVYPFTTADVDFGPLVYGHSIELPEYITFTSTAEGGMDVKIWLSDAAFRDQFTDFSITVIPPLANLNDFFAPFDEAGLLLEQENITSLVERIQLAKGNNPDSVIKVLEFNFVNRYSSSTSRKTSWGILIYGKEGDYIDTIKDAIVDFLLANSQFTTSQWEIIFPEIFQRTEFIVVPRWDKLATVNLTEDASLYSQVVDTQDIANFTANFLNFYGESFVRANSYTLNFPFRVLGATVTNGVKNADGKADFQVLYPDYMPIPTTSPDFGRMRLVTQEWSIFIQELVRQAEVAKPISALPIGMRRIYRDEKLFIASSHKNINYLVAAKWNPAFN